MGPPPLPGERGRGSHGRFGLSSRCSPGASRIVSLCRGGAGPGPDAAVAFCWQTFRCESKKQREDPLSISEPRGEARRRNLQCRCRSPRLGGDPPGRSPPPASGPASQQHDSLSCVFVQNLPGVVLLQPFGWDLAFLEARPGASCFALLCFAHFGSIRSAAACVLLSRGCTGDHRRGFCKRFLLLAAPFCVPSSSCFVFSSCSSLSKPSPLIVIMIGRRRGFLNAVLRAAREEGCSAASPPLALPLQLPFLSAVWIFNAFAVSECTVSGGFSGGAAISRCYCCVLYLRGTSPLPTLEPRLLCRLFCPNEVVTLSPRRSEASRGWVLQAALFPPAPLCCGVSG